MCGTFCNEVPYKVPLPGLVNGPQNVPKKCPHGLWKTPSIIYVVKLPPQIEDIAKLISMKKNKNDQSGGGDISNTADGYETKASVIPENV